MDISHVCCVVAICPCLCWIECEKKCSSWRTRNVVAFENVGQCGAMFTVSVRYVVTCDIEYINNSLHLEI